MSVMDEGIIDFAGLEKNNKLVLSIFDHLVWGKEEDDVHLLMLQNKINDYLRFVESDEVSEQFKKDDYDKIIIRIIAKYHYSPKCLEFLNISKSIIFDAGFELEWEVSSVTKGWFS